MDKWYELKCVNHRDWMIENFDKLELNYQEMILCLLIDFYNSLHEIITYDILAEKLKISISDIDILLSNLIAEKVIIVNIDNGNMTYDLTPLFEMRHANDDNFRNIFEYFEDSFNRPLNSTELNKISDFIAIYSKEEIINAIRIADANQKISIAYIEGILRKGENGKKE